MTVARAARGWLEAREPADARARSEHLVERVRQLLPESRPLVIHDLGCGTGSMRRWLGPQLDGDQKWVEHDRDIDLLERPDHNSPTSRDGQQISVETRFSDITRLDPPGFTGASLITASALLDMLTLAEVTRFANTTSAPRCPVLITLSVVGRVTLSPSDPRDEAVMLAFNDHQRRQATTGQLLGPDAADIARILWQGAGMTVVSETSPWTLGSVDRALIGEWFDGWWDAACDQDPGLAAAEADYAPLRRAQAADGCLTAIIQHVDLLAWYP